MPAPACPEGEFIEFCETLGMEETARRLGILVRNVYRRRADIEKRTGRTIRSPHIPGGPKLPEYPGRLHEAITDGIVLVGSDCHYWPGVVTTAHRAFVHFCRELKPKVVVANGDVFDGASVSRWPAGSWTDLSKRPSVVQEIETCQERLGEIEKAAFKARKVWTLGNHDARLESRLVNIAPEYAGLQGTRLRDHFPTWEPCWSLWLNEQVVIKHRWKGGVYATRNNTLASGLTIVTGHLHSLQVTPHSDYTGTRYGVDTGTLAEPYGPQFEYLEDNARSWRSGFVVLTWVGGQFLPPEMVHVLGEGVVTFRGRLIEV